MGQAFISEAKAVLSVLQEVIEEGNIVEEDLFICRAVCRFWTFLSRILSSMRETSFLPWRIPSRCLELS